jgi:hypothetical protein
MNNFNGPEPKKLSYTDIVKMMGIKPSGSNLQEISNEEIAEHMRPPSVDYEVYNDSSHPDVKKAIYSSEDSILRFYLPDGWEVVDVNHVAVLRGVNAGVETFGAAEVASIKIDSENQRTCMYFSPNKYMIEDDPSLQLAEDFAFHKPASSCSCSHPMAREKRPHINAPCNFLEQQQRCNLYTPQEWTPVEMVKATSGEVEEDLLLEETRIGYGKVQYRMSVNGSTGDPYDTRDHFDAAVQAYDSAQQIAADEEEVTKESFLASILSD